MKYFYVLLLCFSMLTFAQDTLDDLEVDTGDQAEASETTGGTDNAAENTMDTQAGGETENKEAAADEMEGQEAGTETPASEEGMIPDDTEKTIDVPALPPNDIKDFAVLGSRYYFVKENTLYVVRKGKTTPDVVMQNDAAIDSFAFYDTTFWITSGNKIYNKTVRGKIISEIDIGQGPVETVGYASFRFPAMLAFMYMNKIQYWHKRTVQTFTEFDMQPNCVCYGRWFYIAYGDTIYKIREGKNKGKMEEYIKFTEGPIHKIFNIAGFYVLSGHKIYKLNRKDKWELEFDLDTVNFE